MGVFLYIRTIIIISQVNLNLGQDKLLQYTKKNGIAMMAYAPFGGLFQKSVQNPRTRVDDPVLVRMAEKYKKTVPQIALKYLVRTSRYRDHG